MYVWLPQSLTSGRGSCPQSPSAPASSWHCWWWAHSWPPPSLASPLLPRCPRAGPPDRCMERGCPGWGSCDSAPVSTGFCWPWWEGAVDEGHFGWYLGGVVGIGQLGGDVQLEVIMVGNHGVSQFDHSATCLLESLKTYSTWSLHVHNNDRAFPH